MGFAVVVDSTCDFTQDEYESLDVHMVPLSVLIDGETFKDQFEISSEQFYERMAAAENLPQSSQPTPYDFEQMYNALAEKGYDGVIAIHIAGVLSGTIESSRTAAEQVDIDVRVLDGARAGATAPVALVVEQICKMRDEGATLDEAEAKAKELLVTAEFLVAPETLENLLKGGRLSADQVKNASLLNIKPIFTFNEKGILNAYGKAKGMRGVIKTFVSEVENRTNEHGTLRIRFCHSGNLKPIEDMKAALAEAGIEYIDGGTCPCGAIISTHLGPGALGIGILPANA